FAQTPEPAARLPNAMATPPITCRRVGLFPSAVGFFLSLIIALPDSYVQPSRHKSTLPKYVQDNVFLEREILSEAYFNPSEMRRTYALSRWSPHRGKREDYPERT